MKILLFLFLGMFFLSCSSVESKKELKKNYKLEIVSTESTDSIKFFAIVNIYGNNNDVINLKNNKLKINITKNNKTSTYTTKFDSVFGASYLSSVSKQNATYVLVLSIEKYLLIKNGEFKELIASNEIDAKLELTIETSIGNIKEVIDGNKLFPKIDFEKNEFLKLIPWIEEQKEKISFNLFAIRLMPNTGEFKPTSETFRILLKDIEKGTTWNSSEGLNFMQMIGKVEPSIVGDYKIFTLDFNFNKNKNYNINGENEVTFIIPAKPKDYVAQINFWKK